MADHLTFKTNKMIINIKNAIVVFIISVFFVSSTKGEDDPLISLKSRKERMVGDWVINSGFVISLSTTAAFTSAYSAKYKSISYSSNNSLVQTNFPASSRDEQGLFIIFILKKMELLRLKHEPKGWSTSTA